MISSSNTKRGNVLFGQEAAHKNKTVEDLILIQEELQSQSHRVKKSLTGEQLKGRTKIKQTSHKHEQQELN